MIGLWYWNVSQPRIVDHEPIGQIAFLFDNPGHGIEVGQPRLWVGARLDGVGGNQGAGEAAMFEVDHVLRAHNKARREISDQRCRLRRRSGERCDNLEKLLDGGRRAAVRVKDDP